MELTFIMVVGIPYSGKSYLAEKLAAEFDAAIHSSDELRKEMFGNVNHQSSNNELFTQIHNNLIADLKAGKSVIYDATNISSKRRQQIVERARKRNGCRCICYYLDTPFELCLERQKTRARFVPVEVVAKMKQQIEAPSYAEGWDDIRVIKP